MICSHNGSARLPPTLAHLAAQQQAGALKWEVVVVDNASTDSTAETAARLWPDAAPVPLRIVREPRVGLSYARASGLAEARYEIVSFVDDDNWVNQRWIAGVAEVMEEHPEVGACGGPLEAVMEAAAPAWVSRYEDYLAIGQETEAGEYRGVVWGAGLSTRRSVWHQLTSKGFKFLSTFSRGDLELCYALRLAGWKVWLDPRLRIRHFMPASRLIWGHFLKQQRRRHMETVNIDPYLLALNELGGAPSFCPAAWPYRLARTAGFVLHKLLLRPRKVLGWDSPRWVGDDEVFRIVGHLGRLQGLLSVRRAYDTNVRAIANAPWRALTPAPATH